MIFYSLPVNGQKVDPMVLVDSRLSTSARWLYSVLCFVPPNEFVYVEDLSLELDITSRTLVNLLNELRDKGFVKKVRKGRSYCFYIGNSEKSAEDVQGAWIGEDVL
ncbi:MAG: hypothetical protein Tp152SUR00d2C52646391_78 [Prokaryotic dsDNA virus sp.]|nr:MAG: hypothetical protein Tp152SUR00d2C52646391_78 [Prokaryotic dsDNA virus sp.]|tara:strand:+ start:49 stop:366 length:318 start_codon:yes stop_codon:yes gene_type:complete